MIGTTGGAVLLCANILFVGVIGLLVGFVACLFTRRAWTVKMGLTDSATAAAVALVFGILVSLHDAVHGLRVSRVSLVVIVGAAAVPIKHTVQTFFRRHDSI